MNKFIDWIVSNLKYIGEKNKLFLIQFYNKINFLINKNLTLNKMYQPIIKEQMDTNKNLQKTLKILENKNNQVQNNILKLENQNSLLESKISIIQNLITKRHD
ncbi:hypothetical protein [Clostridium tagluense]|uniref:Uncharacterized protein n=1 Tax=Clostridium tagluense TaxID=360422 RepID=A0A401URD2_9CLOT|nr:hypothetical protein [Clostridium tagluense]MBW9156750.1 hypothetical protein [Clostridium tagluense]WLC64907.1 hypothetical protein KTC93_19015 [Clostridium tagluense]GCD12095.1 hypothetical protein Ctaglu_37180 [Clostridium tagluense]